LLGGLQCYKEQESMGQMLESPVATLEKRMLPESCGTSGNIGKLLVRLLLQTKSLSKKR